MNHFSGTAPGGLMSYSDVTVSDIEALLSTAKPIIIDMRDPLTQSKGRLPSAVSASEETIQQLIRRRRSDPAVLVYCYHGNQSRDLCRFLTQMGLRNVHNLAGGWAAWEQFQQTNM
jgi:thiosulfate sulfurtransferase